MRLATALLLTLASHLHAAPPAAPTGFEASDGTSTTEVSLSWDHVRNAELYRVFRSDSPDPAAAVSLGITESVTFRDLTGPDQVFFYWVRGEGSSGAGPLAGPERGSTVNGISLFRPPIQLSGLIAEPRIQVPTASPTTGSRVYLGKTLFWDEQLSATKTVACGTCHIFRSGGTDPRAGKGVMHSTHPGPDGTIGTADDIAGSMGVPLTGSDGSYRWSPLFGLNPQVTKRRASSVIDSGFATQGVLWDGKPGFQFKDPVSGKTVFAAAASLEAQALLPLLDTTEMGSEGRTLNDAIARIAESRPLALSPSVPAALASWIGGRAYPQLFEEAFGTAEITAARIAMAIASYERTLISDRAPIDGALFPLPAGIGAFQGGRCTACHRTPLTSDQDFQATGVRPVSDDPGAGGIPGSSSAQGQFRTPTLRNAALKTGFQHTGMFASLEEVVEFYNRGGDFEAPAKNVNLITQLNLTAQQKADLAAFLRNFLTDPRVEREAGPIFDRPVLYSESARVPALLGTATAATPRAIALEPPFVGNPRFTVALANVPAGAQATLVIEETDPGAGPAIPAQGSFLRQTITTSAGAAGEGFGSITTSIPNDSGLAGKTLYGRWYVRTGSETLVSQAFRFTIFAGGPGTEDFTSVSAASLNKGLVARESIVSGFGSGLAEATIVAPSGALPTSLGGLRVSITDRTGASVDAPVYFVSAGQINYVVPGVVAEGEATVRVLHGDAVVAQGRLQVGPVAPGVFAANSDGRDTAAALVQRVSPNGAAGTEGTAQLDGALRRMVPRPINLGEEQDQAFLLLFGTGIRGRGEGSVTATIGGEPVDVLYSGAQGEYAGMDQVNLRLPQSLKGRGSLDVILTVDGRRANAVRIAVQ